MGPKSTARLIEDQDVVFGVRPIDACKLHEQSPPCGNEWFLDKPGPLTVALEARLSHHWFSSNSSGRRAIFLNRSSFLEKLAFRSPHLTRHRRKCTFTSALPSRGLASSLL
jgi:hypothetical protein